jgi:hypothetical protein
VRYFWEGEINFEVLNPDVSSDWFVDPGTQELDENAFVTSSRPNGVRSMSLAAIRGWHRLRKRKLADLSELLVCPECHGSLAIRDDAGNCNHCRVSYQLRPVPDFNRPMSFENESDSLKRVAQC